jgi:hypothetical protein
MSGFYVGRCFVTTAHFNPVDVSEMFQPNNGRARISSARRSQSRMRTFLTCEPD